MQKVLIISYFAPPCNLTSANRIENWCENLFDYGFQPTLVTRNWTGIEMSEESRLESSGHFNKIVKNDRYTIHYMPYNESLRDKAYRKGKSNLFFAWISKALTLLHLFFQNFTLKAIPYRNLYFEARDLLRRDSSIRKVIISGNLFEQFYFGYLLKKEFPHISWIADFRDEWTTHYLYKMNSPKPGFIKWLEKNSEKKWIKTASKVTTVCPYFAERLKDFHRREVSIVPNGFGKDFGKLLKINAVSTNQDLPLKIIFGGSLYSNQNVDLFFETLSEFSSSELQVEFIGSKLDEGNILINELKRNGLLKSQGWIDKSEMIERMKLADVFLMFPFEGMKGWPSSKLYDYLPYKKPILLCPSDGDIIEEILLDTGLGLIARNNADLKLLLASLIGKKEEKLPLIVDIRTQEILKYSRVNTIPSLVDALNIN